MITEEQCRFWHVNKTWIRTVPLLHMESGQLPLIDQILVEVDDEGAMEGTCDIGRVINSPLVTSALAYGDQVSIPRYGRPEQYTIVKRSRFSAAAIRMLTPSDHLLYDLYEDLLTEVASEHVFLNQRAQRPDATTAPDVYIALAFDPSVTRKLQQSTAPFERRGDIAFRILVDKRRQPVFSLGVR